MQPDSGHCSLQQPVGSVERWIHVCLLKHANLDLPVNASSIFNRVRKTHTQVDIFSAHD